MDNNPADGGRGQALESAAQVNKNLDSLENNLRQLISYWHSSIGPANVSRAPCIMFICEVIKIIRQRLVSEMVRRDIDPSFRLAYAVIAVVLGCVSCGLLMGVLIADLPGPIFVACVLVLVYLFRFSAN